MKQSLTHLNFLNLISFDFTYFTYYFLTLKRYDSLNSIENLGTFFYILSNKTILIILASYIPIALLALLIKAIGKRSNWLKKLYEKLDKILFFNLIFRMLLEGYLVFALVSFVNLKNVRIIYLNMIDEI